MHRGVPDLVQIFRLDAVQYAKEDRFHRLPDDAEDGDGDNRADNGIGKRKSKRNADGAE